MLPTTKHRLFVRLYRARRVKALLLAVAAMPLFQATGCFPDLLGALNFELQSLVNTVLINTISVIVQNFLGL
jgi:hypothetical protein